MKQNEKIEELVQESVKEKLAKTYGILGLAFCLWSIPAFVLSVLCLTKAKKGGHIAMGVIGIILSIFSFIYDLIILSYWV